MSLNIVEETLNVQMSAACPIDSETEQTVSSPRPARYRDMGKLNQLIADHELAVKEREIALDAMADAEKQQFDLGGSSAIVRIGDSLQPDGEIRVNGTSESRENGLDRIHSLYDRMEQCRGVLSGIDQYRKRLGERRSAAIKRLHDACDKLEIAMKGSGIEYAEAEIDRTYQNEDQAICAILAYHATTSAEGRLKGDYLRTTWWYQESKNDSVDIMDHHLDALMQGMGCGVAS
jgi:hypothetical protein